MNQRSPRPAGESAGSDHEDRLRDLRARAGGGRVRDPGPRIHSPGLTATLLTALLLLPAAASAEPLSADDRFAALRLASIPLPGTVDEIVVDEEQALEVFLSPSDFPDALVRLTLAGEAADFAVNLDVSTLRGEALSGRVRWPALGGRPLEAGLRPPAERIDLAPPLDGAAAGGAAVEAIEGRELRLEWYLRPEEGEDEGPLRGTIEAVRLAVVEEGGRSRTVAAWTAAPVVEGCRERGEPRCRAGGASRAVSSLAIDPSGRWVAVAGGDLRPRVDLWETGAFAIARRIAFPPWQGPPLGAEFTPDGRLLVVGDAAGVIHLWDAGTGGDHRRIDAGAQAFALLAAGRLIAVANSPAAAARGAVTLWRTGDGTIGARLGSGAEFLQPHSPSSTSAAVSRLAASGDGLRLAALSLGEGGATVMVWQIEDEQVVGRARVAGGGVVDLALDGPGEHVLATHDERGLLRAAVAPAAPGGGPLPLEPWGGAPGRGCRGPLALSPDHERVACALERGVALFDAAHGRRVRTLGAEGDRTAEPPSALAFSPDGARLIATVGGELVEWRVPQGEVVTR